MTRPKSDWHGEWIYERDDDRIDRSDWTGKASSEADARRKIESYAKRLNPTASGTIKVGNLKSIPGLTRAGR